MTETPRRHSWAEPVRFPYKTERTCARCGLVKVTRHEPGELPWVEFWRGLDKIKTDRTPVCEPCDVQDSADGVANAKRETTGTPA